jgi:hypothetical protein
MMPPPDVRKFIDWCLVGLTIITLIVLYLIAQ